ncbi:O-antigen/teichoic acid export membrane protein [Rhizobium aquaticum]|uniref:O-antigen/teichoic acid export membrane protein n=1 Tax=Rhizobium aquaticum TaxID=1549636 RepID=A0ABV2J0W3_9HYPH
MTRSGVAITVLSALANLAISAATVLTLARLLGPEDFGRFSLVIIITTIFAEIIGLGLGDVLVRQGLRNDRRYERTLALLYTTSLVTGVLLYPFALAISTVLVGKAFITFVAVLCVSETIGQRLITIAEHRSTATSAMRAADMVRLGAALTKALPALVILIVPGWRNLLDLSFVYAAFTLSYAILLNYRHMRLSGRLHREDRASFAEGLSFCATNVFRFAATSVDRIFAGIAFTPAVLGNYVLGSRIFQIVSAMLFAIQKHAQKLAYGNETQEDTRRSLRTAQVVAGVVSLAVAVAIFAGAPLIELIFGDRFHDAIGFVRLFCWLIAPFVVYFVSLNYLSALDLDHRRTGLTLVELAINALSLAGITAAGLMHFGPVVLALNYIVFTLMAMMLLNKREPSHA